MRSKRPPCRPSSPVALGSLRAIHFPWLLTFAFVAFPAFIIAADPRPRPAASTPALVLKTAGSLLMVGGGKIPEAVRDRFVQLAGGKKARLVVIPTASTRYDMTQMSPSYTFWQSADVSSVELLHTRNRQQADDPNFIRPLSHATGVWLAGGDQMRLTESYLHTAVLSELRKLVDRGGVVGGTSAGASVMSSLMITGGKERAELGTGFGLLPDVVVDQHFTNRNRMGRLLGILAEHPDKVGLGIDEQTAAVFQGPTMSIVGEANAFLCLAPTSTLPVSVQRLKTGDQVDLSSLSKSLMARVGGRTDTTTASTTNPAPMRMPAAPLGH